MSKIKSLKLSEEKVKWVFDAVCEEPHQYATNNLISHNCVLWVN